tara:strand:- start:148 stop:336 length:189 start_codon:yes stop_codon:yes gene_type:complete
MYFLRSFGVAHRELLPEAIHDTSQYANNTAELSHASWAKVVAISSELKGDFLRFGELTCQYQ